jgi:hypothetical protein
MNSDPKQKRERFQQLTQKPKVKIGKAFAADLRKSKIHPTVKILTAWRKLNRLSQRKAVAVLWQHGTELRCIRHIGQGGSAHASRTCSTSTSIASTPKRITGSLLTLWAGLTADAAHNGQTEPTPENNHENKNNISSS